MDGQSLKQLVESEGVKAVTRKISTLLGEKKIQPEDVSFQELWEALVGPMSKTLEYAQRRSGFIQFQEAVIDSSAFSVISTQLIAAKIIESYNNPIYIGDMLVDRMTSKLRTETITGTTAFDGEPKEVKEGDEYKEAAGFAEKYVTTTTSKKGRLLSITEEAIFFDKTGQILRRAADMGDKTKLEQERIKIKAVTGQIQVYRPLGVAQNTYNSGNTQAANPLIDWSAVDTCMQKFAGFVDENGDEIVIMPKIMLVPWALQATGKRVLTATEVRTITDSSNTVTVGANPVAGAVALLSSQLIDTYSTTKWWMGDFKKQFVWQEIWPLQVLLRPPGSEPNWTRDIVNQVKVRYYGGLFAMDDKYVVQNDPT